MSRVFSSVLECPGVSFEAAKKVVENSASPSATQHSTVREITHTGDRSECKCRRKTSQSWDLLSGISFMVLLFSKAVS